MPDRETMEMKMMRSMAWERAKGELKSMLCTYNGGSGNDDKYKDMSVIVDDLIAKVEMNELNY